MQQAKKQVQLCFFLFSWENTSKIRSALAFKDTDKMINAFLLSLNYCKASVCTPAKFLQPSSSFTV